MVTTKVWLSKWFLCSKTAILLFRSNLQTEKPPPKDVSLKIVSSLSPHKPQEVCFVNASFCGCLGAQKVIYCQTALWEGGFGTQIRVLHSGEQSTKLVGDAIATLVCALEWTRNSEFQKVNRSFRFQTPLSVGFLCAGQMWSPKIAGDQQILAVGLRSGSSQVCND